MMAQGLSGRLWLLFPFLMISAVLYPLYRLQAAVCTGGCLPAPGCREGRKITAETFKRRIPENDAARQPSRRRQDSEGEFIVAD